MPLGVVAAHGVESLPQLVLLVALERPLGLEHLGDALALVVEAALAHQVLQRVQGAADLVDVVAAVMVCRQSSGKQHLEGDLVGQCVGSKYLQHLVPVLAALGPQPLDLSGEGAHGMAPSTCGLVAALVGVRGN